MLPWILTVAAETEADSSLGESQRRGIRQRHRRSWSTHHGSVFTTTPAKTSEQRCNYTPDGTHVFYPSSSERAINSQFYRLYLAADLLTHRLIHTMMDSDTLNK